MAAWFYMKAGKHRGPVGEDELIELAKRGTIKPKNLIWFDGLQEWLPAKNLSWLSKKLKWPDSIEREG